MPSSVDKMGTLFIQWWRKLKDRYRKTNSRTHVSRALFESVLNSVSDGLIITDPQGMFVNFNTRAQEIMGVGEIHDEMEGWSESYGLYYPDREELIPAHELPLARAIRGESVERFKIRLGRSTQIRSKIISVSATPLISKRGRQIGAVAIIRDITCEIHDAEQSFQSQKMEAIGRLAGGVAHDFNNKLGTILLTCDFLKGKLSDNKIEAHIDHIKLIATKAAELTKQLLAFSRKQVIHPEILEVNDIIITNSKFLGQLIGEDIKVEINLKNSPCTVRVDPIQFDQVLMNLCVNARDAMPKGGVIKISTDIIKVLRNGKDEDHVLLSVADTGIGMTQEVKKRIFEPFFTTKQIHEGTGLGLSTVDGIIKQHGGEIIVESEVGKGTNFKIYLPMVFGEVIQEHHVSTKPILSGREKILVVEDDENLRHMIAEILKGNGYEVIPASHGAIATYLATQNPDINLLLTDVIMPGINGKELADKIKGMYPGVKVIFMSGYTNSIIEEKGVLLSGRVVIQKPVSAEILLQTVRQKLDGKFSRKAA